MWTILLPRPRLPFLPERVHGKGIIALALIYAGDPKQGEPFIEPLRKFGTPLGEHVGVQPYVAGSRPSTRCSPPAPAIIGRATISRPSRTGSSTPSSRTSGSCRHLSARSFSVQSAVPPHGRHPGSAAYAHRDAKFVMNVHGRWEDPADDKLCIGWVRDFFNASAPFASSGVYVNFLTADEGDRVRRRMARTMVASPR